MPRRGSLLVRSDAAGFCCGKGLPISPDLLPRRGEGGGGGAGAAPLHPLSASVPLAGRSSQKAPPPGQCCQLKARGAPGSLPDQLTPSARLSPAISFRPLRRPPPSQREARTGGCRTWLVDWSSWVTAVPKAPSPRELSAAQRLTEGVDGAASRVESHRRLDLPEFS